MYPTNSYDVKEVMNKLSWGRCWLRDNVKINRLLDSCGITIKAKLNGGNRVSESGSKYITINYFLYHSKSKQSDNLVKES